MSTKTYENEQLQVTWEAPLCMHSTRCWKKLGDVFQPLNRPWVKLDGASNERIAAQIDQCPSGALKYTWKGDAPSTENSPTSDVTIQAAKNGPFLLQGNIELKHSDGSVETRSGNVALCRCGASGNKPFCDGSHKKVGFEG